MDSELVRYVIKYFPHLMTRDERLALRHYIGISKLKTPEKYKTIELYESRKKWLEERNIISGDKKVLNLLGKGVEEFERNVVKRIMQENSKDLYLNRCPKCDFLARTPLAKQCRKCNYDWHNK